MICTMKAAELYVKKVIVRNRFNNMIRLGIGTEEVESAARKVLGFRNAKTLEFQREVKRIFWRSNFKATVYM